MIKIPTPRSLYQRSLMTIALIALAPAILLVLLMMLDKLLEALGPWPYILLAVWIGWAGVRYVAARRK